MKKKLIRVLAGTLGVACVLSLSACGGNTESKVDSSTVESAAIIGGADGETDIVIANEDAPYANVEEMMGDAAVMSALQETLSAMESEGLSMEITGEGNQLVYTFTYDEFEEEMDLDALSSALEEALTGMSSTFETIAESLGESVQQANPSVMVVYQTADGTELYRSMFAK